MAALTFRLRGAGTGGLARLLRGWLLSGVLLTAAAPASRAAVVADEAQLKAVFLLNFAQFVEWPPEAVPAPDAPLVIGVVGENPFNHSLDDALRGERVAAHPLRAAYFRRPEDIGPCHILFVSRSEASRLGEVFARLHSRPVLTVSDVDDFAKRGGIINLVKVGGRIRLRINLEAARAARVSLSSKLLRPAEIVVAEVTP